MKIIMIAGKAQSGKDSCSEILYKEIEKNSNDKVLIIRFADLIKFYLREYFDWDGVKDEHGRELLQYVGTDIVRAKKKSYWADRVADFIELFCEYFDYVLIPDTRFINEINTILMRFPQYNVYTLYISREKNNSNLTDKQLMHESENSLGKEDCDFFIENNSSYEDFEKECLKFFRNLEK